MHPLNEMRLRAGIKIDHSLEVTKKTELTEAREVPHRSAVQSDDSAKSKKQASVNKACQHLRNAVKALEAAPATDTTAEIPQMISEIEGLCTELEGMSTSMGEDKPKKEEKKAVKESESFNSPGQPTTSQQFKDGDIVLYDDGIHVVVLSDSKADMVGIIPAGMANASAEEKNRSVEMVKPEKLRKPTEEELSVMKQPAAQRASIDDDMAAQFSMESVEQMEANLREWNLQKAVDGGMKYKEGKPKAKGSIAKAAEPKRKIKSVEQPVKESTLNYVGGNTISHTETDSDPTNVVGQGEKQWANSLDPKEVKTELNTQLDNRGEQSMTDYETKVKCPPRLKSALKDAISSLRSDAERQPAGHTGQETAQLYADTADAYEKILDYLNTGTVQSIKQAQVFASSLMGPMLHKMPDGVWDFIVNGGQKRSLKDYMIDVSK